MPVKCQQLLWQDLVLTANVVQSCRQLVNYSRLKKSGNKWLFSQQQWSQCLTSGINVLCYRTIFGEFTHIVLPVTTSYKTQHEYCSGDDKTSTRPFSSARPGICPSCHRVRDRLRPGQVTGLSPDSDKTSSTLCRGPVMWPCHSSLDFKINT